MALYYLIIVLLGVLYLGMSFGYSDIANNKKCEEQFQVCLKSKLNQLQISTISTQLIYAFYLSNYKMVDLIGNRFS